jgi:hypothetical protein
MPIYLAQNEYKNPVDPNNGVFQYTKGWKGDMFHYYEAHPVEGASFDQVMGGVMANQARWVDIFPSQSLLNTDKGGDSPLVVDVGGNIGHDIEKFREMHPETAARLYLEDRPEVVARSKCPDTVNKLGYNFFTPRNRSKVRRIHQLIAGPKVYGLTISNLHDQEHAHIICMVSYTTGPTSQRARF